MCWLCVGVQDFAAQVQVMEELKTQDKTLVKNTQVPHPQPQACMWRGGSAAALRVLSVFENGLILGDAVPVLDSDHPLMVWVCVEGHRWWSRCTRC